MNSTIPFNKPHLTNRELEYITQAHAFGALSGDGPFTRKCHAWFEENLKIPKALLTHSCTGALEMMALLTDISPGDEVIMPSFTFVSTANAFALRGAIPVFVDVRPDTFNLNEDSVERAIGPKTRAIVAVHYAGVGCEMDALTTISRDNKLFLFEDAAQGFGSTYRGKALGTFGEFGALSFHETKNVISGEGGLLMVNDPRFAERAEIIREKGTNRSKFFRGQVDKYTWVDIGSSYLPGEIIAAFLFAQLEQAKQINARRLEIWHRYNNAFKELEDLEVLRRPSIPSHCVHNGHMFYLLCRNLDERSRLIAFLAENGIKAVFHYVSLHDSPAGKKFGKSIGDFTNTRVASDCLVRLPMFFDLTNNQIDFICDKVKAFFRG